MNNIKISVIIPVFNKEKEIARCLDSVLTQTFKDIEVILVDNGSTDRSVEIINEYVKKDKRLRLLFESSTGAGSARNKGIKEAKGEYIHFLDGDDYLEKKTYELMYSAFDSDVDVVKVRAVYDGNNLKDKLYYEIYRFPFYLYNRKLVFKNYAKVLCSIMPVCWNGLYRRSFIIDSGILFNGLMAVNDRSFNIEVLINARSIVYLNKKLIHCQSSNGISTVKARSMYFDCLLESIKEIIEICDKKNTTIKVKKIILKHEYRDALCWYKRIIKNNLDNKSIDIKMKEIEQLVCKGGIQ